MNVYIINLHRELMRFVALCEQISASGHAIRRIEGCPGSSLPDAVCLRLTCDPNALFNKGALGCFLSHVRAWELIAQSPEDAISVVMEDDATIVLPQLLDGLTMPGGYDLVFTNERALPEDGASPGILPIARSLSRIARRGYSVGLDSYALNKRAAQIILNAVGEHGHGGHVDMRLLAYCTRPADIPDAEQDLAFFRELRDLQKQHGSDLIEACSLSPPLTVHVPSDDGSRAREDRHGQSRV